MNGTAREGKRAFGRAFRVQRVSVRAGDRMKEAGPVQGRHGTLAMVDQDNAVKRRVGAESPNTSSEAASTVIVTAGTMNSDTRIPARESGENGAKDNAGIWVTPSPEPRRLRRTAVLEHAYSDVAQGRQLSH